VNTVGTKTNSQAPKADWSLKPRGVVSGTAQTAMGIALAGATGDLAHINPVWAGAGAVVGALSHLAVSAHHAKHTPGAILYRLGCWVGAGSWLTWTWASHHGWWNTSGLAALAIGAAGAGIMAPIANHTRDDASGGRPGMSVVLAAGGRRGREWQERIRRCCRITVQVSEVTDWQTRTGHDVHVLLPIGGATIDDLARHTKAMATDARLPKGCAIDVTEGNLQGEVVLSVPMVNRLTEEIPFVADHRPRSIMDPVELGEYQNGNIVGVPLRQLSALAVGMRGSGKTNLLDLFTDGVGKCVDALVWHIDLNGGGMSWSWMQPWINGETDRPAIDWPATTAEEALLMVQVAYAIGLDRKGSYNHLKLQQNSRLMPLSRDLPFIGIVVDEGKTVLSGTATGIIGEIRNMLTKIQDELRDAGVGLITSGLRGTATYIDTDFKSQVGVKVGMPVERDAELAYLFDWDKQLKCSDLPTSGCGYVQYHQHAPRMFKARHMLPADVTDSAVAVANIRPDLDAAGQRIGGEAYATRYDRAREVFSGGRPAETGTSSSPTFTPAPAMAGATATTPGRPRLTVMNGGGAANWPDPRDIARAGAAPRAADWPDPAQLTGRAAPAGVLTAGRPAVAASGDEVPEPIRRVLAVFDMAGDDRIHSETLAAELGVADQWALADLLRPYGLRSRPQKFKRGGKNLRGYWLDDINDAVERIARGEEPVAADPEDDVVEEV
jgi:S-DNA-T family DNA segregation ATPase FtsK/SpoIIIE